MEICRQLDWTGESTNFRQKGAPGENYWDGNVNMHVRVCIARGSAQRPCFVDEGQPLSVSAWNKMTMAFSCTLRGVISKCWGLKQSGKGNMGVREIAPF